MFVVQISGAIADSLKPRHEGPDSDIEGLRKLIGEGVNMIGGHAIKGTTFRFDCSKEGVAVTVDSLTQGTASFEGLGAALVDAFLDADTVCPTLVEDCIKRSLDRVAQNGGDVSSQGDSQMPRVSSMDFSALESKSSGSKSSGYDEFVSFLGKDKTDTAGGNVTQRDPFLSAVDANVKSLKEPSTGVTFDAKLARNGLYLAGVGVRKKSFVKVYAGTCRLGLHSIARDSELTVRFLDLHLPSGHVLHAIGS